MRNSIWLAVLSVLLLASCSPMEQHSDDPEKKPLPHLESNVVVHRKWTAVAGRGSGRSDIKLLLTEYDNNLITADQDGKLVAISISNGQPVWDVELNDQVSSGPSVAEGKILLGTSSGKVIAVDMQDGKVIWKSPATSEVLSAPLIADGVVYVHTMDGALTAYSLNDGRQLWRFNHSLPPLVLRAGSTPAVSSENIIAGFSTGKLLAINKTDGTINWTQDIGHPKGRTDLQRMVDISADPLVRNGVVYAASYQGDLVALNATNGQIKWDRHIPSFAGFILNDNTLYVSATNGDVVAVDSDTGHTLWLQDALHGRRLSKPAIMQQFLIVCDNEGTVHWIQKQTGKLVGRYQLDKGGIDSTPITHNNIVYILGRSGKLVALEVT